MPLLPPALSFCGMPYQLPNRSSNQGSAKFDYPRSSQKAFCSSLRNSVRRVQLHPFQAYSFGVFIRTGHSLEFPDAGSLLVLFFFLLLALFLRIEFGLFLVFLGPLVAFASVTHYGSPVFLPGGRMSLSAG